MIICKWWVVAGVKVQGLGEKFVAEVLEYNKIKWSRPKCIKTPFGNYTPDFELEDYFIEVKGMRTALKMIGKLSLLEKGRAQWAGSLDEKSYKKIVWVHKNIKPLIVYINDNPNDEKYMCYMEDLETKLIDHDLVYGKKDLIAFVKSKG